MHKFYLTNNLGGGGTNVSRLYDYLELFRLPNIGILLNYYYLTGHAKPSFDVKLINKISEFNEINDFANYCREYFKASRDTSSSFKSTEENTSINGFILDNGCGNFLRNMLAQGSGHAQIAKMIKPFLSFAEEHGFDLSVALDLAMKYTYKANEVDNSSFMSKWTQLASDNSINLSLLSDALKVIKSSNYTHKILAPLHGYNNNSFADYLEKILQLEKNNKVEFGGFALGGIADTRKLDSKLWNIPDGFTKNKKSAYLCYNLIKTIREKTDRHIHVLGAGNIYTLPFLIHAGANSSDCHSAWRRASDGGIDNAKILIPLMDKDYNFINNKNCLEYVNIGSIDDGQYKLNCGYTIKEIKNLFRSNNREDYYFAEIILFLEAIIQYNILIQFINDNPSDYLDKLVEGEDNAFNESYSIIRKYLKI